LTVERFEELADWIEVATEGPEIYPFWLLRGLVRWIRWYCQSLSASGALM